MGVARLSDANATLTVDTPPLLLIAGTASRTLTLPSVTPDMKGMVFFVVNGAAFTVVVNNASAGAVATVPATVGATGMIVCLGDATQGIGGWSGGL